MGLRRVVVPRGAAGRLAPGRDVEVIEDAGLGATELDAIDGAVTGCAVAIAETGTVVLDGTGACGRRLLTLVPDHHICVVTADQIVELVPGGDRGTGAGGARAPRPDHARLGAVGELGHRAVAGRGRARAAPPAGANRGLSGQWVARHVAMRMNSSGGVAAGSDGSSSR